MSCTFLVEITSVMWDTFPFHSAQSMKVSMTEAEHETMRKNIDWYLEKSNKVSLGQILIIDMKKWNIICVLLNNLWAYGIGIYIWGVSLLNVCNGSPIPIKANNHSFNPEYFSSIWIPFILIFIMLTRENFESIGLFYKNTRYHQ